MVRLFIQAIKRIKRIGAEVTSFENIDKEFEMLTIPVQN